jgi:alpha-beta hydrolase superfamily lysophospholipase
VKTPLAVLSFAAVLLGAFRCAHSASGFLVTGLGLALLLDRYAWRLLPWPPVLWARELAARAVPFLAGGVTFYLLRPGIVPLREAAHRGMMVCLVAFLGETMLRVACRRQALGAALVGLVVLVAPVIAALHPLRTVPKRPPSAIGLAFEDVRFRTADGLTLAAWYLPHPRPRGTVIFCHGHGRNRGHGAGLFPTFHDLGLNVLAFDFRGHGDSEGHTSTFGAREVRDVVAAEAYAAGRCPGRPVFLVGVSLGAAVALQALPELPRVKGVWSEGAYARLSAPVNRTFAWLPRRPRAALVGLYYRLGWLDCGLWGPSVAPIDRLGGARAPVFFCHGARDGLVPLGEGQALHDAYPGPKEHWWVEGASHYNVRSREREQYLRRLRGFLAGCLAREASGAA